MSWWVVPDDAFQTAIYDATHSINDQGYPAQVIEGVTRPTAGSHGPYATRADAQAELDALSAAQHAKQTTNVTIPGVSTVSGLISEITSRKTLVRIAEGVLGILLILVGVAKLADGTTAATMIKKVPLV
jgi:hypothetical protein